MEPKKNFMRTLAIVLAIITILIGGIWYVKTDIDKKIAVISEARKNLQLRERSLSELAALQSDAEKATLYLPQINKLLTSKDQLFGFSTDISFIAQQAGFSGAPKFKEESAPPVGNLQKTSFSLTLEGRKNLSDLGTFFSSVEKSNYFVRFSTMDISQDESVLRASMDGHVISF